MRLSLRNVVKDSDTGELSGDRRLLTEERHPTFPRALLGCGIR
jgi:hypothetical protein